MIPSNPSIEVLLDPISLPFPTIGLYHMEGRFLHLLPSEHNMSSGSPFVSPEGSSPSQQPPQLSSGAEMKRIHLDPSLCQPLTPVTSLVGHSFSHLRRIWRGIEQRLPDRMLELLTKTGQRVENTNIILDIGNGKVEELISYNQLLEHMLKLKNFYFIQPTP